MDRLVFIRGNHEDTVVFFGIHRVLLSFTSPFDFVFKDVCIRS